MSKKWYNLFVSIESPADLDRAEVIRRAGELAALSR
jgi:hypothetical protein